MRIHGKEADSAQRPGHGSNHQRNKAEGKEKEGGQMVDPGITSVVYATSGLEVTLVHKIYTSCVICHLLRFTLRDILFFWSPDRHLHARGRTKVFAW